MKNCLNHHFIIGLLIILSACNNQNVQVTYNNTPYVNEFEEEQPELTVFTYNNDTDTNFTTVGGTLIKLTKGQFIDKNGTNVRGLVTLKFREYHSISDMIYGKLSTVCDGKLLATDGMFYVNAQGESGDTLKLNTKKPLIIDFHLSNLDTAYYTFYNDKTTRNNFGWKRTGKIFIPEVWDTVSTESFLNKIRGVLNVVELGFINCDKFINTGNNGDIFATISCETDVPVACTIVMKNYKTMVTGNFNGETFTFKNIPLNEEAVLVCVGKAEGKYYLTIKDFKTSKGLKLTETMTVRTKEEAETELKKLNSIHPVNS